MDVNALLYGIWMIWRYHTWGKWLWRTSSHD